MKTINIKHGESSQAPDIQVRREALDTRQSFILEAPAGSGKTALLTARFLSLLPGVGHPRQILAVTFTRKAAAEMADRITRTLRKAQAGASTEPDNPWEALLLNLARNVLKTHPEWDVLLQNQEAFLVDTFHGFCGRVARNWPLESRTPPAFTLLDEIGQATLLEAAVVEYLHAFAAGDKRLDSSEIAAFQRRMAAANNSVLIISNQLADLLARRDRLDSLIAIFQNPHAKDELKRRTQLLADLYLSKLRDYFFRHTKDWQAIQHHLETHKTGLAQALTKDIPGTALRDVSAWQSAAEVFLVKSGTPRKQFKAPEFCQDFAKIPLSDFIRNIPSDIAWTLNFTREWLQSGDPVGFNALSDYMRLAQGALERYGNLMQARGLDFMELELAALRAFNQVDLPGESLIFYHEHLRHILVDEAQDINDTQARILSALTEGWDPEDGRTVFIVGDPKQSIFRFRRAEVSLFDALKTCGLLRRGEANLPLRPLNLSANFRSRPHLVAFSNKFFAKVMETPDKVFDEVDFNASEPARDNDAKLKPVTIGLFYCRHANNRETPWPPVSEAREQEACYVADRVAALHRENPTATVAILLPARTHLPSYVRAMETLAVPVRLMEGIPMLDCPEVRHLLNLFKALLRPHDDIAWAGVLRAPWCRVPVAILEKLALTQDPERWSEKITGPGRQLHPEILRFCNARDKVFPDFGREPYAVSLQRFWEEINGPAAVLRMGGPASLANCKQCLDLCSQCPEGRGEETLDTLERLLGQAYTPPDPRATFSPVTIMTIHKAKGLEFDHVFAVGLDREPGGRSARRERDAAFLMDRLPYGEREYLAATSGDQRTDICPLAHLLLKDLGHRRNMAEYKRLIYVAATRARETLTLTGLLLKTVSANERQTAIAWLDKMDRERVFESLPVQLLNNPKPTGMEIPEIAPIKQPPAPAPFKPECLPYLIRSPSTIEHETARAARPGTDEADPDARARGVVMHRLFETMARNEPVPRTTALATALAIEGIHAERCQAMAEEVYAECCRAWDFPPFVNLRNIATEMIPEWAIEDCPDKSVIRVGRIDLILKSAGGIVLVDFKTGRPGQDHAAWLETELERYRPQLVAYREMAAKALCLPPERIQAVLFFTAILRWVNII